MSSRGGACRGASPVGLGSGVTFLPPAAGTWVSPLLGRVLGAHAGAATCPSAPHRGRCWGGAHRGQSRGSCPCQRPCLHPPPCRLRVCVTVSLPGSRGLLEGLGSLGHGGWQVPGVSWQAGDLGRTSEKLRGGLQLIARGPPPAHRRLLSEHQPVTDVNRHTLSSERHLGQGWVESLGTLAWPSGHRRLAVTVT